MEKAAVKKIDKNTLFDLSKNILDEMIQIRHKIHSNPEIMFKESETSELIRSILQKLNIEVLPPYIETDIVGVIKGSGEGKTVMLRADIDALNILEKTDVPWCSKNSGLAHSCGHDGHIAILLGAITVLTQLTDKFNGNIKFVFQPAEEGGGGGKILVEKGILTDKPEVDEVYGLHGWPGVKEGYFESCAGPIMAAVDDFEIQIKGKGGHAAMPYLAVDPVVTAANVITALQTIVSRNIDSQDACVISITMINGGKLTNVIPDSVTMKGTVRYFKKEFKAVIKNRIESIISGVCSAYGAQYILKYDSLYIPLINTSKEVESAGEAIKKVFGENYWSPAAMPSTTSEDFSFYLDKKPGMYYRLGLGTDYPSLHNSAFDFNDKVLQKGIISICAIALNALETEII